MNENVRRIDGHVHFARPIQFESLESILRQTGADAVCLLALPGTARLDPTPDVLCYKLLHPETTYAFGCLDCTVYERDPLHCGRRFVRRAKQLLAMGCDGVKLLEGKPTMRRVFPIPDFDSPGWEPFWAYAEQTRLSILWHVNDPEQYWNPEAISDYAKSSGWGYGEQDVNNEQQYRQVRAVLERHPKLSVTFAHLFFLSANLPRLAEWLDRFPSMRVDLTPGIELYENLSKNPEETRAFFIRFADRIQLGTDIGGRAVLGGSVTALDEAESLRRVEIINAFLEGNGERLIEADGRYLIRTKPFVLRGLGLGTELLEKICRNNFLAFAGESPHMVRVPALKRACRRLKRTLVNRAKSRGEQPDLSAVEQDLLFLQEYHKQKTFTR
ncbi:MAG: hypothetical protein ABFC31_11550 [Clostridiaceae bacterium]